MYRMVMDVESIGLHGEGFAVGFVVINDSGEREDQGLIAFSKDWASGTWNDHEWVRDNATPRINPPDEFPQWGLCRDARAVRDLFWQYWMAWKEKGAQLWADCAWPVEARFLIECVNDDPQGRRWEGPYPLHEIATLSLAKGYDPLADWEREPDELPKHNPLMDARQSARILHLLLTSSGY